MLKSDQVFLHIGYHKTGTTFLQSKIIPALEADLDRVITPDCRYLAEAENYDPGVFLAQLDAARQGPGNSKVIVSAETLSGRGDGNPMWNEMQIAERLRRTFGANARIIAVVRNPFDYILSLYTFRVVTRGLERRKLADYLEDKFEGRLSRKMDYFDLLSRYVELFGRDRVLILTYEEFKSDYRSFMSQFCGFLGVEIPEVPPHKVNPGYRDTRLVTAHRRINAPAAVVLDALTKRSLLTQAGYVRAATFWFALKRRFVHPLLAAFLSDGPKISIPADWESRMSEVFKPGSNRLEQLMKHDLGALGWPT